MHAETFDRRNSRLTSELPTLKVFETSRWPLIVHNQGSEPSKLVKHETSELPTYAETPDRRNFRPTSELPTNQPENNKNFNLARHIPDTSGINTGQPDQQK